MDDFQSPNQAKLSLMSTRLTTVSKLGALLALGVVTRSSKNLAHELL